MKRSFRTVEFWKSSLMTLPDGPFFELMRSVFGNIKTPFSKQKLLDDLCSFLGREEIREIIAQYIDGADARVMSAIVILEEPAQGELESFFAGELSYADLEDILLNLEERFIIYRFREEGLSRLALNPALEKVISPFTGDFSVLFPSRPSDAPPRPVSAVPDDRVLAAILSRVYGEPLFFKSEGGLRKKALDSSARIFPGLDIGLFTGAMLILGLLRTDGESIKGHSANIDAFGELSALERLVYCAAGICCYKASQQPVSAVSFHIMHIRISNTVTLIRQFIDLIKPGRLYPLLTLKRYKGVLEKAMNGGRRSGGLAGQNGIAFDCFLEALEETGLLVSVPEEQWAGGNALYAETSGAAAVSPVLAMDTSFSFIIYPAIAFKDASDLAVFSAVKETGAAVRFELTRETAVRGFNLGIKAELMIDLLRRLSGNRINESLIWTMNDWEKRYNEVSLQKGLVLTLSEDRRYLAGAEPVASIIRKTLAPGVYLLTGDDVQAEEALRKAGVDIIAMAGDDGMRRERPAFTQEHFPPLNEKLQAAGGFFLNSMTAEISRSGMAVNNAEMLKEKFRQKLEGISLSKEERVELRSRIERRLILTPSQLEDSAIRYEKLEARGLDYVGKASLAKQAIAAKSLLEVIWPHEKDGTRKARGIPLAIEKSGGESILVLDPINEYTEQIRIPIGKISLLRRIKKSIFGE
jgi:hypothetical protein